MSGFLKNFSSHYPLEVWTAFEQKTRKVSHPPAYKRKIHPNRTPFRSKMSRIFLSSHLSTADKNPVWPKKQKIFFLTLLPADERFVLAEKMKFFYNFSPITSLPRKQKPFWRKIRKFIFRPLTNPSGQEWAYWPKLLKNMFLTT